MGRSTDPKAQAITLARRTLKQREAALTKAQAERDAAQEWLDSLTDGESETAASGEPEAE